MTYQAFEKSTQDGAPVELYLFQRGATYYSYTTGVNTINYQTRDYVPAAIRRSSPSQGRLREGQDLILTLPGDHTVAQFFRGIVSGQPVDLTIFRYHDTDSEFIVHWIGRIRGCTWKGLTAELACESLESQLKRLGLGDKAQLTCNHVLYDQGCTINRSLFKILATVSAVSSNGLTITATAFSTQPNDWLKAGELLAPSGERRWIVGHTGNNVTLRLPFSSSIVGLQVEAFAGCDHVWKRSDASNGDCITKFNNALNFGGHPFLPIQNPFSTGVG